MANMHKLKKNVDIDTLAVKLAGFGTPVLIFLIAFGSATASGLVGAAAITTALSIIGPGGMLVGIGILIFSGPIIEVVTQGGFNLLFSRIVKELYNNGETKETILEKIDSYKVSTSLKLELKEKLNDLPD